MDHSVHNKIVSFIWSIADDCLRDIYVRGKYRDVILPMFVLRRLDCLLETTKNAVMEELQFQKESGLKDLDDRGLQKASGQVFYNTSDFTLQILKDTASNNIQILKKNFNNYLDGFSDDVQEIIEKFKLRQKVKEMGDANILLDVIEKFTDKTINLSAEISIDENGKKLPALTNLGMGYVFEELIRKFNEENNEEAGEHFTPREVIELMNYLVFLPVKENLPNPMLVYDPACGSGGMLTESQNFINDKEGKIASKNKVILYGKEINPETYAICKSDMLIKGNDPKSIKYGSTLSTDSFSGKKFDFMLSNPPYGKSWATEVKNIKDGKDVIDSRFEVTQTSFAGAEEKVDAIPPSSDGQLLFLMEMVSKMKDSSSGTRIASVHNGSSIFTGDAGSGSSNIRRHIIENDLLEAIVQLPTNLFYNTGITTYIWLLTNRKTEKRKGVVQLINAEDFYRPLRRNLGDKNCELSPEHIEEILSAYLEFESGANSEFTKVFKNEDLGYFKIQVEKPMRKSVEFTDEGIDSLKYPSDLNEVMSFMFDNLGDDVYKSPSKFKKQLEDFLEEKELSLQAAKKKKVLSEKFWNERRQFYLNSKSLMKIFKDKTYDDFNIFLEDLNHSIKAEGLNFSSAEKKELLSAVSSNDDSAKKVIKKKYKIDEKNQDKIIAKLKNKYIDIKKEDLHLYGYFIDEKNNECIEYETSTEDRDFEYIPLETDILKYYENEVLPYDPDSWISLEKTKIGYDINFRRYFYKQDALPGLDVILEEIKNLDEEIDCLKNEIFPNEASL